MPEKYRRNALLLSESKLRQIQPVTIAMNEPMT